MNIFGPFNIHDYHSYASLCNNFLAFLYISFKYFLILTKSNATFCSLNFTLTREQSVSLKATGSLITMSSLLWFSIKLLSSAFILYSQCTLDTTFLATLPCHTSCMNTEPGQRKIACIRITAWLECINSKTLCIGVVGDRCWLKIITLKPIFLASNFTSFWFKSTKPAPPLPRINTRIALDFEGLNLERWFWLGIWAIGFVN